MKILRQLGRRLWVAHLNFQEHEGALSAAGIAYYVALSFFPLLLVLVAGLGSVLQWTEIGQNAREELRKVIAQQASPDLAQQVDRSLRVVSNQASASGPIGFLVLVVSAIAIFSQLDSSFDRIFRVPGDPHISWLRWIQRLVFVRLKALGMLIGLGGFVFLAMVASMIVTAIEHALEPRVTIGPWMHWATSLWINVLLNLFAFTLIFRVVPKPVITWRCAFWGGLLAAVLWEAGRQALTAYFLHLNYPSAYGIIGSFIAVMLWAFYASVVLLYGAEYVRVLREEGCGQQQQMFE